MISFVFTTPTACDVAVATKENHTSLFVYPTSTVDLLNVAFTGIQSEEGETGIALAHLSFNGT